MKIYITAYPFAVQNGVIEVPDNITNDSKKVKDYIIENWDKASFDVPALDYKGIDFDIEEEEVE